MEPMACCDCAPSGKGTEVNRKCQRVFSYASHSLHATHASYAECRVLGMGGETLPTGSVYEYLTRSAERDTRENGQLRSKVSCGAIQYGSWVWARGGGLCVCRLDVV